MPFELVQNYKKKIQKSFGKKFRRTALKIKEIKAKSQWVKTFDAKSNHLTMIPVTHMVEEQK